MKLTRRAVLQSAAALSAMGALEACVGSRAESRTGAMGAKAAASKRILILGGTGFLGPQLVEAARARGHVLTLFNRGKTHAELFPDLEKLHGDRDGHLEALATDRQWDAVIDTSGYVPRIVRQSADLLRQRIPKYVFVSTISVYADTSKPCDESSPLAQLKDPSVDKVTAETYGGLKALCEKTVAETYADGALIVRPGLIVGPGDPTDRFTYWPVRLARGGEVLAPGDGKDAIQFIDARDLAAWMIHAIEEGDSGVFNATGPATPLTTREFLAQTAAGVGASPRLTWVPSEFLAKQNVAPWSDLPVWLPERDPELTGASKTSNHKAIARGLTFRPTAETAKDTLAWFRTLPADRQAKLHAGLTPEREQAVLAAWHQHQGTR